MIEKISKVLYEYKEKGIDESFVEKIALIYVQEYGIDAYLKNIQFYYERDPLTSGNVTISTYNPISKEICLYLAGIMKLYKNNQKYYSMFNKDELMLFDNALVAHHLLHELEHANQRKIVKERNDIEAKLLKTCLSEQILLEREAMLEKGYNEEEIAQYIIAKSIQNNEYYKKYYNIVPNERMAEIKSLTHISSSLKNMCSRSNVADFMEISLLEAMLMGYQNNSYPTEFYLKNTNQEKYLRCFDWYNKCNAICLKNVKEKYSLQERTLYGLPIEYEEKNKIEEKIAFSKKYKF